MTGTDEINQDLGAFARIFVRDTAEELAIAFEAVELTQVQLNLNALGIPTIPTGDDLKHLDFKELSESFSARGRTLWGISATYNTAHPDLSIRRTGTRDAARFISRMRPSGAVAATLCSGSRNPDNMWGRHPETSSEEAWRDFRESLDLLLPAAEESGVLLAIEPEPANAVGDVDRALRLIDELGADSSLVGFILDPANLVSDVPVDDHESTLKRAFDVLGDRTICVHAKDTVPWSSTLDGNGVVDYGLIARLYLQLPNTVPLIIQDAAESELSQVADLLREQLMLVRAS